MMGNRHDNTGKPYEILVQAIFQAIHDQEEVATLVVERNKTLQGKTTPHQIDVYWKFEKGGIPYEAIVQAKDWQSRVKISNWKKKSNAQREVARRGSLHYFSISGSPGLMVPQSAPRKLLIECESICRFCPLFVVVECDSATMCSASWIVNVPFITIVPPWGKV